MTRRKFFGGYFHRLCIHAPEIYRIVCLRSLVAENEERTFGDLKRMAEKTSSRRPNGIIGNAMIRYQAMKGQSDSYKKQESHITKEYNAIKKLGNTVFEWNLVLKRPAFFQSHLERVADFVLEGQTWWRVSKDGLEFLDCSSECNPATSIRMRHFRSTNVKEELERIHICWRTCISLMKEGDLTIPVPKIREYRDENSLPQILTTQFMVDSKYSL